MYVETLCVCVSRSTCMLKLCAYVCFNCSGEAGGEGESKEEREMGVESVGGNSLGLVVLVYNNSRCSHTLAIVKEVDDRS